MSRVIVTGAAGYIGGQTVLNLLDQGHSVMGIDNTMAPQHLIDCGVKWYIGNFADELELNAIKTFKPDAIIHCAGTSLVGPSMTDPGEYYDNNISKTIRLLNVIKDMEHKPYIMFSSSASVYGVPEEFPIFEDAKVQPISPYGNTKAITETILKDYATAYGISSVVFRYFNAAGAMPGTFDLGQEPGATHIVARVLEAAINNQDFTLYGSDYDTPDGTCIRDYVHVWDIARAHTIAADFHGDSNLADSHIYNLGTCLGTSNMEIVRYVTSRYNLNKLLVQHRRPGDPPKLVADYNLAHFMLGWSPENSNIETIIDSAYKWYTRNTETVDAAV